MLDIPHDSTLTKRPSYSYASGEKGPTALVKCSNGHIASLTDHTIRPDGVVESQLGEVSPSLVCPNDECDWHENVRLLDWPPPRAVVPEQAGPGGLV